MLFWAKNQRKFFCTKFFDNPSGHGRPHRKSWTSAPKSAFSCGPGGGEELFDPGASGRKGQECPREIRTKKFMFLCCFFFPELFFVMKSLFLRKCSQIIPKFQSGKSKGGLSKGWLGPKGANWAKKGPFGALSALPPWLWGAEELVPIGPEKAPIGPEEVPICPEKTRFHRKDFPPDFL